MIRSPLPKLDGTLTVPGIDALVVIRRDDRGIPHITAFTEPDLYFGEGFACAQDRLWQMDLLRRVAEGRLSEILGEKTVDADRYFRTLGFGELARRQVALTGQQAHADLDAFAAGVNAAAANHPHPLEFRLLRYRFEPWTPADSLAIGLLEAQRFDDQWKIKLLRSRLAKKFGGRGALALTNDDVPRLDEYVPGYGGAKRTGHPLGTIRRAALGVLQSPSAFRSNATTALGRRSNATFSSGAGSNAWVVAGRRVTSGKPVLSNDTHIPYSVPGVWWMVALRAGSFNVEGFTIPGLPGVIVGHNGRIAWGVTSAAEDVQDLYRERFRSPRSDEYLVGGRWQRAQHRRERISVRDGRGLAFDILTTRHGPVVEREGSTGFALAWTLLRARSSIDFVRSVDAAANWQEFRQGVAALVGPALSFVYADVDGNIGFQNGGRVPLRATGGGAAVVDGTAQDFDWRGDVPFDRLPHVVNPPQGVVATANAPLVPDTFRPVLSTRFGPPYRVHEIYARLSPARPTSPATIGAIQGDVSDRPGLRLAHLTERGLRASTDPVQQAVARQLRAWDGRATADSRVATYVNVERQNLEDMLVGRLLGVDYEVYKEQHFHAMADIDRALDGDPALAALGLTRSAVLAAIGPAARTTTRQLGLDARRGMEAAPPWGDRNAAVLHHPIGVGWPLSLLNFRPVPQPGNAFTPFAGRPDEGPSMRFVADLSDWDSSSMVLMLGESGIWTDYHYGDQLADWLNVRMVPTPFSDAAVDAATKDTLRLVPAR